MPDIASLTLEDVVDETARYKADALRAMRDLARTKPWQGNYQKRFDAIEYAFNRLLEAYGLIDAGWTIEHHGPDVGTSAGSRIDPDARVVRLTGRLSVVTMLHLFAKVRQVEEQRNSDGSLPTDEHGNPLIELDHYRAIRWSASLFKRKFPISFSRCRIEGGVLVNDGLIARERERRERQSQS